MVEFRQHLTFVQKAVQHRVAVGARFDQLDRDAFLVFAVSPRRFVNRAHATRANAADQPVMADHSTGHPLGVSDVEHGRQTRGGGLLEQVG